MRKIGVVVPAHNEQETIGRLLRALEAAASELELVVVCNGCTDDTAAEAARLAPWATVIELPQGSKPAALRAGDSAITAFPRLYLDADVVLSAEGTSRLVTALDNGNLLAVAPTPKYSYIGASWIVRSHYRVWTALYTHVNAVSGTGAIMVSLEGRRRFGDWPDVIADDFYLDRLFGDDEKSREANVTVDVRLPTTFRGCVSRKARVHQGMMDVRTAGLVPATTSDPYRGASLISLVRADPKRALDVPAHLLITASARLLATWRRQRGSAGTFYRDSSSRT